MNITHPALLDDSIRARDSSTSTFRHQNKLSEHTHTIPIRGIDEIYVKYAKGSGLAYVKCAATH